MARMIFYALLLAGFATVAAIQYRQAGFNLVYDAQSECYFRSQPCKELP